MPAVKRPCLSKNALLPISPKFSAQVRIHDRLITLDPRLIVSRNTMPSNAILDAMLLRQDLAEAPQDSIALPVTVVLGLPCQETTREIRFS